MSQKSAVRKNTETIAVGGIIAAMAIVIGLYKFPIFSFTPFLEFDFADLAIILLTVTGGLIQGISCLAVVCFVQAFPMGGHGLTGFTMHFAASCALLIVIGLICKNKKNIANLIVAVILGSIAMTVVMIPMSYIFYPGFGIPISVSEPLPAMSVNNLLFPYIIPFNLIKSGVNSVCAVLLFYLLMPFLRKTGLIKSK